jgi:hypothetical protein
VKTRLEALGGLRDTIEKRAAQVLLHTSGPRNGRVLVSIDDDISNSENPNDIKGGEISEHDDKQEETKQHDTGPESDKVEGDGSPLSISTVLAKYAAVELNGRKWMGRIANAEMPKKWNMDSTAEGNVSDDEQRIIGEDDEFWHDR